jgi:coenzyme F420-0:L-glutamate ligase/coenzyme F420-1:gamma-L-glutamate ligase
MANAGIDQSNLGPDGGGKVLLLPIDPDRSATTLRGTIATRTGVAPGVVISDSFGRPWRMGVVNVAIGASGLEVLIDKRGERDRDGRIMEVTQIAVGDMIATAAGMVCGEGAGGVPAALVRGYGEAQGDLPASALLRPVEQDLFQ